MLTKAVPLAYFAKRKSQDPPIVQLNVRFQHRFRPPLPPKLTRVDSLSTNCQYLLSGEQLYKFRQEQTGELRYKLVNNRPLQVSRQKNDVRPKPKSLRPGTASSKSFSFTQLRQVPGRRKLSYAGH